MISSRKVFISGHLDLTPEEFAEHYAPRLLSACRDGAVFHVGDARGADAMAQEFLAGEGADVVVYHMFDAPRNCASGRFKLVGGFVSDNSRDAAMTSATTDDVAWIRPGREKSGTARNLARRFKAARSKGPSA